MDPRLPLECLSVSRRFSDDLDVSNSVLFAILFRVNVFIASYATTHTKLAWHTTQEKKFQSYSIRNIFVRLV